MPWPGVQVTHRYDTGGMSGGITLRGMNYNNTSGGNVLMLLDALASDGTPVVAPMAMTTR